MKIKIVDDLSPEDVAMLQALYSRSAESVDVHLEKVAKAGSGKFMESYYVGYNHKSIADCGSTTVFTEGVSLLAAKAIQDWPLYSGQETSTRYIDMSKQHIVDPIGTPESKKILDRWMEFYTTKQDAVGELIRKRYPKRADEKQESYDRAVKARTFDILRGFLPAGITTQLSWHTNLRQGGDHLRQLVHHPLGEIQRIAVSMREKLAARYPSSGFARPMAAVSGVTDAGATPRDDRYRWEAMVAERFTYSSKYCNYFLMSNDFRLKAGMTDVLRTRPPGCVLPHLFADLGLARIEAVLDFGSFRDIQRHRNGVCRMPLLDLSLGFNRWYLEQLGDPDNENIGHLRDDAVALIYQQQEAILRLHADDKMRQYYIALGFNVSCQLTYGLPALLYVMELRSSKTVHPTLRTVVHQMVKAFRRDYPDVALHVDMDPDDWTVRRGEQTITEKK